MFCNFISIPKFQSVFKLESKIGKKKWKNRSFLVHPSGFGVKNGLFKQKYQDFWVFVHHHWLLRHYKIEKRKIGMGILWDFFNFLLFLHFSSKRKHGILICYKIWKKLALYRGIYFTYKKYPPPSLKNKPPPPLFFIYKEEKQVIFQSDLIVWGKIYQF